MHHLVNRPLLVIIIAGILLLGGVVVNHPRIVHASNSNSNSNSYRNSNSNSYSNSNSKNGDQSNLISVAKCCEPEELLVDDTCTPLTETNETEWRPEFLEEKVNGISRSNRPATVQQKPNYQLKIGRPKCRSDEHQWNVYHYQSGEDRLAILTNGVLRHYTRHHRRRLTKGGNYYNRANHVYGFDALGLDDDDVVDDVDDVDDVDEDDDYDDDLETISNHHDYSFGHYCIDKAVLSRDRLVATYAMVCVPNVVVASWTDTDYLMKHGIDPIFHAISIASYLIVAIVYFVLPQLRDLVGNMITSMTLCLIAGQCASMVRIFTEFGNHVSFMVADTVMYVSLLAAFFWLNAFGYYVWSTFRSRNVFLRVSDGRKYCYYSSYVWTSTLCIAGTAIFAHFALETNKPVVLDGGGGGRGGTLYPPQETIGWLGISMLFTSIAFTIIIDLSFVLTTANRIKRMSTYGRIHHKMKYSFRMFVFLFAIMSTGWLSFLISRLNYNALLYSHIVINLLQAIFILYVCVFGQRRVTFLLGKTCNCCNSQHDHDDNIEGLDWGEEMTAINAGY